MDWFLYDNGLRLERVNDKPGRVLIIRVKIENKVLLFTNLYNTKTQNEQLSTLSDLSNVRKNRWY